MLIYLQISCLTCRGLTLIRGAEKQNLEEDHKKETMDKLTKDMEKSGGKNNWAQVWRAWKLAVVGTPFMMLDEDMDGYKKFEENGDVLDDDEDEDEDYEVASFTL